MFGKWDKVKAYTYVILYLSSSPLQTQIFLSVPVLSWMSKTAFVLRQTDRLCVCFQALLCLNLEIVKENIQKLYYQHVLYCKLQIQLFGIASATKTFFPLFVTATNTTVWVTGNGKWTVFLVFTTIQNALQDKPHSLPFIHRRQNLPYKACLLTKWF